jgi:hypothetical protein
MEKTGYFDGMNLNLKLPGLLILCLNSATLFSQGTAVSFEWTAPKNNPQKSLYKLMAFLDSRQDTTCVGNYSLEQGARPTKLILKTPIQPQLEAILNAYTDASSGFGAALFQLKRFSFAETQRTVYTYISATLYALKDNGYVPLLNLDTTLVIEGPENFQPALAYYSSDVVSSFIAKAIVMAPVDTVVYSYDDVQHIDLVRKRKLKAYNTGNFTEGFYSCYNAFKNQAPDLRGVVKLRSDSSMTITLHSSEWTEPRGKKHIFAVVYKGVPYIVTHFGYNLLEKQGDDFYFSGRLNVAGSAQSPFGLFTANAADAVKHNYRVLIDYTNGEFIHLKAPDPAAQ